MSKGLKVALILISASLLLCGAVTGGIVLWFRANADTLKADGDKAKADGKAYGLGRESGECIDEGLRRLDAERGIVAQALNNIFVETCIEVSDRSPTFCEGVPKKDEILASATWAVEECVKRAHEDDQPCARLMQAVQKACAKAK